MQSLTARIFGGALGVLLLAWGLGMPLVGLWGAEAAGTVTQVRRYLGDRGEAVANRYSYAIAYEFGLPDGLRVQGHANRVGGFFSPSSLAQGSVVQVRYLPAFPSVHTLQGHWPQLLEQCLAATAGAVLLYLVARGAAAGRGRKRTRAKGRRHPPS